MPRQIYFCEVKNSRSDALSSGQQQNDERKTESCPPFHAHCILRR